MQRSTLLGHGWCWLMGPVGLVSVLFWRLCSGDIYIGGITKSSARGGVQSTSSVILLQGNLVLYEVGWWYMESGCAVNGIVYSLKRNYRFWWDSVQSSPFVPISLGDPSGEERRSHKEWCECVMSTVWLPNKLFCGCSFWVIGSCPSACVLAL